MRLTNLKIGVRLALAFGTVLALLATVSIIALVRTGSMRNDMNAVTGGIAVESSLADQMRLAATQQAVRVRGNFKANSADGVLQATLQGLGVAAITTMAAAQEVRAGRLVRLLPQYRLPEGMMYASYLPNPTKPQCVQTFVHFLASELGDEPYWERGLALRA